MKDYLACAKKVISKSTTKIVSFDIFDTLLVRPCIDPKDIFALCDRRARTKYPDVDFIKLRYDAENRLSCENVNIHQIWTFIGSENHLEPETTEQLKQLEISTESQLLRVREVIKELYQFACEQGKRIIAISDMYLPASILYPILIREGLGRIEAVYVSCDCHANKSSGELYRTVCDREGIKLNELAHIGDNYLSDYLQARKIGVNACYIPSNKQIFLSSLPGKRKNSVEVFPSDALDKIVFGFVINSLITRINITYKSFDLGDFSTLFVFPLLLNLNFLLCSDTIQSAYANIYFASRDGYLPLRGYNAFKESLHKNLINGKYLYASRLSYSCLKENSIYSRLTSSPFSPTFTVNDYLQSVVPEKRVLESFLDHLSDAEKATPVADNKELCVKLLNTLEPDLSNYFNYKKGITKEYYRSVLSPKSYRILVFDIGYNGSVSAIAGAFDTTCKVDKVYLWESEVNKAVDKKEGTNTYLVSEDGLVNHCGAYEVWLSPPSDGTCIGITNSEGKLMPFFEKKTVTADTLHDINLLHEASIVNIKRFAEMFGDLAFLFSESHKISCYTALADLFLEQPCIIRLFENMQFEDAVVGTYNRRRLSDFLAANNRGAVIENQKKSIGSICKRSYVLLGYWNTYYKQYGLSVAAKTAFHYMFRR